MSKHTPAPWRTVNGTYHGFEEGDIATVFCVERVPTEDGLGAGYVTIVGKRQDNDAYRGEQTANARLIVAAPETAAMLQDFADVVEAYLVHGDIDLEQWIRKARLQVAIAYGDEEEVDHQREAIAKEKGLTA